MLFAVVTSFVFIPVAYGCVTAIGLGKAVLMPRLACGRVVCVLPVFPALEAVKSISAPTENECAPFVKLMTSAHCVNGLYVVRGDATPKLLMYANPPGIDGYRKLLSICG